MKPNQKTIRTLVGACALAGLATGVQAGPVSMVEQAVNIFASGPVTGGAPFTVDAKGPTAIGGGVEFPGFAFGTYDVDVSSNSLTMTFVNDPANLGIAEYESTTVDSYYFEFDKRIASASLASFTPGFAAVVQIMAPGAMASAAGSFVPGLPTSFDFGNGGVLVLIGDGTNLNTVGTGGSLKIDISAVPLPASLPLLLVGLSGFAVLRRRRRVS